MHTNYVEIDGDDVSQGFHADTDPDAVSAAAPGGFVPLGDAALAVVLRLRTRLPRVLVVTVPATEGDNRDRL